MIEINGERGPTDMVCFREYSGERGLLQVKRVLGGEEKITPESEKKTRKG